MAENPLEAHLSPLSGAVADYEVRRIRATAMALEIAHANALYRGTRSRPDEGLYGTELPVRSSSGTIRGRIDAVVSSPQGPVLRDYKSGVISDDTGAALPAYAAQLRLYAALCAATTGIWPVRLEIVALSGQVIPAEVDQAQCTALLGEVEALLETTNLQIDSAGSAEQVQVRLASPSHDACRYCRYRPVCLPYLVLARAYPGPNPRDVVGRIAKVNSLGNARILLTVQTSTVAVGIRGLEPVRHPALRVMPVGIEVGVFDARTEGSRLTLTQSPATTIFRLGDARV